LALLSESRLQQRTDSRLQKFAANTAVGLMSSLVSLSVCETVGPLRIESADYLSVTTVPDAVLGMTIEPNASGFDTWGFRNPAVPKSQHPRAQRFPRLRQYCQDARRVASGCCARNGSQCLQHGIGRIWTYYQLLITRAYRCTRHTSSSGCIWEMNSKTPFLSRDRCCGRRVFASGALA
jgi:hypothetical protein